MPLGYPIFDFHNLMDPFVARGVDKFHMQHLTQFLCHERVAIGEVGFEIDIFSRPVMLPIRV